MSAQILQFPTSRRADPLLQDWRERLRAEYPELDAEALERVAVLCSDVERMKLRESDKRLAADPRRAD